jgi:hypothetical protein
MEMREMIEGNIAANKEATGTNNDLQNITHKTKDRVT